MTTETKTETETVSKAEFERVKDQMQTWMGKATDIEKKLNGKSLDFLIAAAEERDILAAERAKADPKQFDSELNRRVDTVRQELGSKLTEKDNKINELSAHLKELRVVDSVVKSAGDSIYKNAADDFREYVRRFCDEGDAGQIVVKDSNGKPRYSPENPSKLMSVEELINELKTTRDHWFSNKIPAGGHQPGEKGAAPSQSISSWAELSKLSKEDADKALEKLPPHVVSKIWAEGRAAGQIKI
jgi:hypothetical protein